MTQHENTPSSRQFIGLEPGVALGLAGAVIFFVLSGVVAYLNLESLKGSNERVIRTHEAIVALDELLSQIQDAETGQRGFVLTNEDSYLAPYHTALAAIPIQLNEIADLTAGNTGQGVRLLRLRERIDSKLGELKETIDLRRT